MAIDLFGPVVRNVARNGDSVEVVLFVPGDLIYFRGHFPDAPILPGVVQLDWAYRQACVHFELESEPSMEVQIKFRQVITPESEVVLTMRFDGMMRRLAFAYKSAAGGEHSSGQLKFR